MADNQTTLRDVWEAFRHWRYVKARYDMERRRSPRGVAIACQRARLWAP